MGWGRASWQPELGTLLQPVDNFFVADFVALTTAVIALAFAIQRLF